MGDVNVCIYVVTLCNNAAIVFNFEKLKFKRRPTYGSLKLTVERNCKVQHSNGLSFLLSLLIKMFVIIIGGVDDLLMNMLPMMEHAVWNWLLLFYIGYIFSFVWSCLMLKFLTIFFKNWYGYFYFVNF